MKSFFTTGFLSILLLMPAANAEQAYDYGVEETYIEQYTCSQRVDNSLTDDSGIILTYTERYGYSITFVRDVTINRSGRVFNSRNNIPNVNDIVYIKLPNEEFYGIAPNLIFTENYYQKTESALILIQESFIINLLQTEGNIKIVFSGERNAQNFSITENVILQLAGNFGQRCLGKQNNTQET